MITFNHEKFIAQAIEGVLMQKTDFPVRLIIGEDCSTDRTREICIEYKNKYPDRITLRLPEKNMGGMGVANFLANVDACVDGYKYVAMCEGDDYWTDPLKLQKQIDSMEANAEIGMVYTDIKEFHQASGEFKAIPGAAVPDDKVVAELIRQKYINFPSIALRADLLADVMKTVGPELQGKVIGDTRIILEFAQRAKVHYIPEVTTVYRVVSGSASHPTNIGRFVFVADDTYQTRKNFVRRYKLNPKLLGIPVCNFNRAIINNASVHPNYIKCVKLLSHLKITDMVKYCDFATFREKIDAKIIAKFLLSLIGVNALRNSLKNKR
ncbi:MAG: glycosyltransferase [Flavobacterium sp.]|nr:MAG: glycosyltransferase [Flavobacterium sp.]